MEPKENKRADHIHPQHGEERSGKSFHELAFHALKENNLRITKSRLAVIECLGNSVVPLSPKSIYESLIHDYKIKIDQVSVYRILEAFSQLNLVHQVFPSGNYLSCTTRCEHNSNHIILNCLKCGKVNEIHMDWSTIYKIFEIVKNKFDFQPLKQMFQIDGMCKQCR